ncbi:MULTISPECIES: trifunctional serine/threonine-protein kinase/ATP-binding protein/sensor histidine kinase [Rhizobium]|uniref:trifunctional serine/threonine-protein kinase/ATP-binding protein/sensor histidine kinase n=1 Tax=Rhizobium TaxID=379 RepID=UPI0004275B16|nr:MULTISPECIES: ATP-binding protein [Rhizobium]UFS79079.1 AAA family ATPase [Rhizobium sp. T136]
MDMPRIIARDLELALLEQAYARVSRTGYCEIVLISGAAGVGKTALARQFLSEKPSVAMGKAGQAQSRVPYFALLEALRSISASPRRGLLHPELHLAAEMQVAPKELETMVSLPSAQVQENLHCRLIEEFQRHTRPGQPLVIFLDDLQWLDRGSLDFVQMFATSAQQDMLLVGTYCDSQVDGSLHRLIEHLHNGALAVTKIDLLGLRQEAIRELLKNTYPEGMASHFAFDIHAETAGNPFHVSLLVNHQEKNGRPDTSATLNQALPALDDDARDMHSLIRARIEDLPATVRQSLHLAACIGTTANAALLAKCLAVGEEELADTLRPAVTADLIRLDKEAWSFAHDTLQAETYEFVYGGSAADDHACIAKSMVDLGYAATHERLLSLADQICKAVDSDLAVRERFPFAAVLANAARLARRVGAHDSAFAYLDAATCLYRDDVTSDAQIWELRALRCECLLEDFGSKLAESDLECLVAAATTDLQRARGLRMQAVLMTLRGRFDEAVEIALSGLRELGIELPRSPSEAELDRAYETVSRQIDELGPERLIDLPLLDSPGIEASMELLSTLQSSFFSNDGLMFLHLSKMVELTLQHGVTGSSCYALAWFGVSIASRHNAKKRGVELARAALAIVDRHGFISFKTATLVALDQVSVWTMPLSYALDRAREAFNFGRMSGDLSMACYACNHVVSDLLAMGENLSLVEDEIGRGLVIARRTKFHDVEQILKTQLAYARSLTTNGYMADSIANFHEDTASTAMSPLIFWKYLFEGVSAFFHRDLENAARSLKAASSWIWASPAHIHLSDLHLYSALTATGAGIDAKKVAQCHRAAIAGFADDNPFTFNNKLLLIDAEIARVEGRDTEALNLFERSAQAASAAGFLHEQGLAHELAARHARSNGLAFVSQAHVEAALKAYGSWGATAKVKRLSQDFAVETGRAGQTAAPGAVAYPISPGFAEEPGLRKLIKRITGDVMQRTGARYGLFLSPGAQGFTVEARADVIDGAVRVEIDSTPLDAGQAPLSVLDLAFRTGKTVHYGDAMSEAGTDHRHSLSIHPARSLLCLPLMTQGVIVALVYLENNVSANVFSTGAASTLELFSDYAATSLQTSRLFADLMARSTRRFQTEAALHAARAELIKTSHLHVLGGLGASIAHEINQPLSIIVSNAGAGLRWMKANPPELQEVETNLTEIEKAGLRAGDIIKAVRSLAKETSANLELIELDGIVADVLAMVASDIEESAVVVERMLNAGATVLADSVQLQQVVLNLITNALEAMCHLDGNRTLRITTFVRDAFVVATVEDSGAGISPKDRDRIFSPFFTTKAAGLGMGLAICRSIAQVHGGTLDVASTTAAGTIMVLSLPLAA